MLAIFTNFESWGGVDVLTQRFAEYLRERDVRFCLVANGPSRLQAEIKWASVINHTELEQGCESGGIDHVYFPSVSMLRRHDITWRRLGEARVFTLVVQPIEPLTRFVPALLPAMDYFGYPAVRAFQKGFPKHLSLIRDLFHTLSVSDALGTMDGASDEALTQFFGNQLNGKRIPIPAPAITGELPHGVRSGGEISVAYLGRVDAMKWSALQPVISHELAALRREQIVTLHAVAEGQLMGELARECGRHNIRLQTYGYLPNARAKELIADRADISVAMGTAALDLAGSGVPCVVINPALRLKAPPQRLFHFLHEARRHTLGEYRDAPDYVAHGRSFAECVAVAMAPQVRTAEVNYVRAFHAPEAIFQATVDGIKGSRLTGQELAKVLNSIEASFTRMRRWYGWTRAIRAKQPHWVPPEAIQATRVHRAL